ncbi:MAG: hypothetical protein ABIC95_07405 [archaeon]
MGMRDTPIRGKKGFAFTLMAIIVVGLLIASVAYRERVMYKAQADRAGVRIEIMNEFVKNTQEDLIRATEIISFRTILSLEQYIVEAGIPLDDVELRFAELMLNGSVNNTIVSLMENSTLTNWTSKLSREASRMDASVRVHIRTITLNHIDPWNVEAHFNISTEIDDDKGAASWDVDNIFSVVVPIEGFEDPTIALNTLGRVSSQITRGNLSPYVDPATNDTTNLLWFINGSYYRNNSQGPSFLDRMEGNLSASPHGIERLLNLQEFLIQDVEIEEFSVVDWMYFRGINDTTYQIEGVSDQTGYTWFVLDLNATYRYDCDQLIT